MIEVSLRRRRKEEEEKEEEGAGNQPIHEPCTTCIVGIAKGTSTQTSDSSVKHPAHSASGPSECPRNWEIPDSKVQRVPSVGDMGIWNTEDTVHPLMGS